jgi:hypothetical protein
MELEEEKKYSAAYMAERAKEKEAERKLKEQTDKQKDHLNEWAKKVRNENNVCYEFMINAGGKIVLFLRGMFDKMCTVPKYPEYTSVDNVLRYVMYENYTEFKSACNYKPHKILLQDNAEADAIRNKIFTAYKNALKVYHYCEENGISVFDFRKKVSPEFGTMYEHEIEKFFKELEKGEKKKGS